MNLGDKYNHRVTLRLTDAQYDFLLEVSKVLGVSPSDYMRMTVNAGMMTYKNNSVESIAKGEVGTDENVKTDINNLI